MVAVVNHNPEHSMPFNSIGSTGREKNLNDLFHGNIPRIISKVLDDDMGIYCGLKILKH